jgi:ATP-dependent Lhr-like helicase
MTGNWFILDYGNPPEDPIDEHECIKDRVRLLLKRYGILFRELLANELPPFRWSSIFRTLRIMEFSGEVLTGHFFEGIQGLQFVSQESLMVLQQGLPLDSVYWMNAADPASLCGIKLEGLKERFTSRIPSNAMVFHGTRAVLVSRRNGESIEIDVPPVDDNIPATFPFSKISLTATLTRSMRFRSIL